MSTRKSVGGQRSQRHQCRPDRGLRHPAPCAGV